MLSGLLYDANGERLVPTHTTKGDVRYRYYASRSLMARELREASLRIPATDLETLVLRQIRNWLADRPSMLAVIQGQAAGIATQKQWMKQVERVGATWDELKRAELREFILAVVARIEIHTDRIDIALNQRHFVQWFNDSDHRSVPEATQSKAEVDLMTLTVPVRLKRRGTESKFIVEDGSEPAAPDSSLIRLLVRAHVIRDKLLNDKSLTLDEVAKSERIVPSYATRLFRLTLLAPDLVVAILEGRQPPELTAQRLIEDTRLPLDWGEQRRALGFA